MEDFILSGNNLKEMLKTQIPKLMENALKDSYDSPIKKAIENEIKEKEWVIHVFIRKQLKEALESKDLKELVQEKIIENMINSMVNK